MVKVTLYNTKGDAVGEIDLSQDVFDVEMRGEAVSSVVTAHMANARSTYAHAKDRSEVRGGGRKPWKQKGTGRARHGSIRSPLWVGGGVTFGPTRERVFTKKVNKKMKRAAVRMCLSDKVRDKKLVIVDGFGDLHKTKELELVLEKLPSAKHKTLLTLADAPQEMVRATRNISYLATLPAKSLNVMDVLKSEYVVTTKEGVEAITGMLQKS